MDVPITPYLTRKQLGERLHVKPRTLANWAVRGEGPTYRVLGGRVLYRLIDVEAWEQAQWAVGKRPDPTSGRPTDRAADRMRFAPDPEIREADRIIPPLIVAHRN